MVGADGEVGRRRPRLDLLVRAMGEDPVRETLDVSGEDWESILSGGMELDETLLARLEKMPYIPLSAGSGEKRATTTRYLSMARSAGGASGDER